MAENEPVMTIQALPKEILAFCLQLLADEYYFWDLWRVGLVNKNFLLCTNTVQNYFAKRVRDINPSSFTKNIVKLCETYHRADLEGHLRNYLRRFQFPEVTEKFRASCKRCKEPTITLMQVADSWNTDSNGNSQTSQKYLIWCKAKNAVILCTASHSKGSYLWEYYDDYYKSYDVLNVTHLIETIVSCREYLLKHGKQ